MFQAYAYKSPQPLRAAAATLLPLLLIAAGASARAQTGTERGALLYDTHCVACHTTEAHWRDKKQATNWRTLLEQVRIWQASGNLDWTAADIEAVSVYLNRRHYHFPPPPGY